MRNPLIIGTRGSALARRQSEGVAADLAAAHAGLEVELKVVRTSGDLILDAPLSRFGGKGLFLKELEEALRAGEVHCAVHSLKDVPTLLAADCSLAVVTERADPFDVVCLPDGREPSAASAAEVLQRLQPGARVGTSSLRRRTQVLALRPDVEILPVRGNVETRLAKLDSGEADALVLAYAGLARLGLEERAVARFGLNEMVPAAGQGSLAVEVLEDDAETAGGVAVLDDPPSRAASDPEQSFMRQLGADCSAPVGGYAEVDTSADHIELVAVVGDTEGNLLRDRQSGALAEAATIGERLAERMRSEGADELLRRARESVEAAAGD